MAIGTQYKTSSIILNECLMGFEDTFELNARVNTDYQEMIAQVNGMPTGGSISVRTAGYVAPQTGQTFSVQAIEQQYETILVDTTKMLGQLFAVNSVEFAVDRNKVTDTSHYEASMAIGSAANLACYQELLYNTPIYVGDSSVTSVDYSTIAKLDVTANEMQMPKADRTFFMNTRDYYSSAVSINTGGIFDQPLTESANQFIVAKYAGLPIVQSNTLISLSHTAGTAGGKTLTFTSRTSTDSYKSAVIVLGGGADGDTLVKGDRLTFAVTKLVGPTTRLPTAVPLQLIVQNETPVVAAGGGVFTGVEVVCGLLPLSESAFYGNIAALPGAGENVKVEGDYNFNVMTTRSGFTFATVMLEDISTLEISDWYQNGNSKRMQAPQSRNIKNASLPFNIRTSFDISGLTTAQMQMRIDVQPVYKAFQRLNVALITKKTA